MIYVYLFEVKSIQQFLFSSGKLKDVISASERLDRLIDSPVENVKKSVLSHVLETANLISDIDDADKPSTEGMIRFLRCKGGAFYAYCEQEAPLNELRSLWTLTVRQLFPSLTITDALEHANSLSEAMDKGHKALAASRNAPQVSFPIAPAIAERYSRTGNASVPLTALAQRATHEQESNDDSLDLETERHRQAYQSFGLRDEAALQGRFTPDEYEGEVYYPINFEEDFDFDGSKESLTKSNREAIKDMALIHIDGNGLGLLLMALKDALSPDDIERYRKGFRTFSDALSEATVSAAKVATKELIETVNPQTRDSKVRVTLPMRPVVLGGDDVTLFCRADLALRYSRTFCQEFKQASKKALQPLFDDYLPKETELFPYITASGGVLFHKAGHPFMQSHHLVEALCSKAKALTKSVYLNSAENKKVGPAALAIYRVSNATQLGLEEITDQSLNRNSISMGMQSYFVSKEESESQTHKRHFELLDSLLELSTRNHSPVSIAKWRQMATYIALNDINEANRIYLRSIEQCGDNKAVEQLGTLLTELTPTGAIRSSTAPWYWVDESNQKNMQTMINDLLILEHYQPVNNTIEHKGVI